MMQDLLGEPINWDHYAPQTAAEMIYDLADREPRGSAERARLQAMAGRYAAKARAAAAKQAARDARILARNAEDIARIKRASSSVPA